ncbi:MAG: DUF4465 domain-containing protein [Bacteroidales bacterium]
MTSFNRFTIVAMAALTFFTFQSCSEKDQTVRKTFTFQSLELEEESYWNGSDESGGFSIDIATFNNDFNAEWSAWSGFAYSNTTDIETPGWNNESSAYIANGGDSENIYAVSYVMEETSAISFDFEVDIVAAKFTNSTYAYHTISDGDFYASPFSEGDWFKLIITGFNENDVEVGEVEYYLADFRDGKEYITDSWTRVNLSALNGVSKVLFTLESSDVGDYGMNTPAYFCMDDLEIEHMN